ncbi:glycoside hydrolase family 97 protein [Synoicihabitans lomoniglobus]|uniref:Glycoside hydrolase family 97 catalytic domain-containing protein n=1 Tax=Synoicihabitans lomoniglobus TaxID=2909285 RepID=A0AAF0CNZ1_9BACT|nr:glycoside hydrolase family 97 protein [Opitutaceae bacterium LMO-M01]WED63124.1 glycoside hydrolase family 97 catalytic domain-containing protein [Opitutaceae bacterium LMO-M01]
MPSRLSLALALVLSTSLPAQEVSSPDGRLSVTLDLSPGGALSYRVTLEDTLVIEPSPLGLESTLGSFSSGLTVGETATAVIDEHYTLPNGKVRNVHYQAHELTATFANRDGNLIDVVFRVSNTDVAFAYRLPSGEIPRVTIERESTGFDLPDDATAFVTWQAPPETGWMQTKPSYEEGYLIDVPVGTDSPTELGFTYPALFRLGDQGWVLISETGVSSNYVGTRLADPTTDGLYRVAFPQSGENGGIGDATASASLPLLTPWRTITVGRTLATIVETTVATDVVTPQYEPSIAYQGGRATWSWLLWQDASMNETDQRTFIDLAAEMNYEYVLIDALWDTNLGREKLAELVAYAQSKHVNVLLWYNSNGAWNNAPQGPRNRMNSAPARQAEMAWLQSIGIKGLKVDFFGGDKQATMKLYEDILTDGNAYGLHFNFHGATLPRGWERMYPNHMTSEAATASENLVFSQGFCDGEAQRSTIFPFVRNPVAAFDYGPMVLNRRLSRDQASGTTRRTTDAFQLATTVLFQSPVQHFGLTPNNLEEQPAFVIDFLKTVPTRWDETRFIAGYPGKLAVLARRHEKQWYVAATNGEDEARTVSLSAPFLAGQTLTLIHDQSDGSAACDQITIATDGTFDLALAPRGGAVLSP